MAKKGKVPKPKLSLRRRIWRGAVVLSVIAALFFGVLAFSAMVDEDGQMGWRLRFAGGADPVSEYRLLVSYGKPEHHRTAATFGGLALSRSDYNYEPETNARRRSLLRGVFYREPNLLPMDTPFRKYGFGVKSESGGSSGVNRSGTRLAKTQTFYIQAPFWFLIAAAMLIPAAELLRHLRKSRRGALLND